MVLSQAAAALIKTVWKKVMFMGLKDGFQKLPPDIQRFGAALGFYEHESVFPFDPFSYSQHLENEV